MLTPRYQKKFKKDVDKMKRQGKTMQTLKKVMQMLITEESLPEIYLNHPLKGEYSDCMECHLSPDWLLIYLKKPTEILFVRTGSHSELFR